MERAHYGKKSLQRKRVKWKIPTVLLFLPTDFLLLFHLWVIFVFSVHFAVSDCLKPISLFCKHTQPSAARDGHSLLKARYVFSKKNLLKIKAEIKNPSQI